MTTTIIESKRTYKWHIVTYGAKYAPKGHEFLSQIWVPHLDTVKRNEGKYETLCVDFKGSTYEESRQKARQFFLNFGVKARAAREKDRSKGGKPESFDVTTDEHSGQEGADMLAAAVGDAEELDEDTV